MLDNSVLQSHMRYWNAQKWSKERQVSARSQWHSLLVLAGLSADQGNKNGLKIQRVLSSSIYQIRPAIWIHVFQRCTSSTNSKYAVISADYQFHYFRTDVNLLRHNSDRSTFREIFYLPFSILIYETLFTLSFNVTLRYKYGIYTRILKPNV